MNTLLGDSLEGTTAMSATIGGTISSLSGGSFQNGAMTAAFAHLYNDCLHGQCGTMGDDDVSDIHKITEKMKKMPGHNDIRDARRHALWSKEMYEINPTYSKILGYGNEIKGFIFGQPHNELMMDLHNNHVGREAARLNIPISRDSLVIIGQPTKYD